MAGAVQGNPGRERQRDGLGSDLNRHRDLHQDVAPKIGPHGEQLHLHA